MARALSDARRRDAPRGRCDAYTPLSLSFSLFLPFSPSLPPPLMVRCSPFLPPSLLLRYTHSLTVVPSFSFSSCHISHFLSLAPPRVSRASLFTFRLRFPLALGASRTTTQYASRAYVCVYVRTHRTLRGVATHNSIRHRIHREYEPVALSFFILGTYPPPPLFTVLLLLFAE